MPNLSDHQSSRSTKLLLIGDSGTGKTGALTSLLADDYKLRVLDYDNGLDSLVQFAKREHPDKLGLVEFETLRDKIKGYAGDRPTYEGIPDALTRGLKLLDKWSDGSVPSLWDEDTVLVIDSLTHFGNAAFAYARAMSPSAKEPRQWFYTAQQMVEATVARLTSETFRPNVIVTAHVTYQDTPDGGMRGFPTSIGQALGSKLLSYFNNVALVTQVGSGQSVKRQIQTAPTALLALKNPAPFSMAPSLPITSGLADYFETVRK